MMDGGPVRRRDRRAGGPVTAHVTRLSAAWSIGANPNGGYAVQPVLRALCDVADRPDPASVTVHYLRPALGDADGRDRHRGRAGRPPGDERGRHARPGRRRAVDGRRRAQRPRRTPASDVPDPGHHACPRRTSRRRRAAWTGPSSTRASSCRSCRGSTCGSAGDAAVERRRRRGVDPAAATAPRRRRPRSSCSPTPSRRPCTPSSTRVGWVPTLELTVHVRRRPAAGWVQARLECDDVADGWMIETGSLWDETGALVARSRQLGLVMRPRGDGSFAGRCRRVPRNLHDGCVAGPSHPDVAARAARRRGAPRLVRRPRRGLVGGRCADHRTARRLRVRAHRRAHLAVVRRRAHAPRTTTWPWRARCSPTPSSRSS